MKRRTYLLAALGLGTGGYAYTRGDGEGDGNDETGADSSESDGQEYEGTEAVADGTVGEERERGPRANESESGEPEPGINASAGATNETSGDGETPREVEVEKEWRYNEDGTLDVGWRVTNVSNTTLANVVVTFVVRGEDGARLFEGADEYRGYKGLPVGGMWEDFFRVAAADLSGTPAEVTVDVSVETA